jgi:hypothetical protein
MKSRLDDIPVYEQRPTTVPAAQYNQVQIALKRLERTLHIPLPGLRTLQMELDAEAWIVFDTALNDIPVLAWTDFQAERRAALHQPVSCSLKLYHAHALVILDQVIALMDSALRQRLETLNAHTAGDKIIPLDGR